MTVSSGRHQHQTCSPDDEEQREHAFILQRMWCVNGKYQELLYSDILKVQRTGCRRNVGGRMSDTAIHFPPGIAIIYSVVILEKDGTE